jgi:hypothetical protein
MASMELTPEERQRIYEEEKARLEARQEVPPANTGITGKVAIGIVLFLVVMIVLIVQLSKVDTTPGKTIETGVVAQNTGNIAHDRLLTLPASAQAYGLGVIVNEGCIGQSAFFMGQDQQTKEAYWSVRCANGKSYEVRIEPNSTGSTDVVDCELLKAFKTSCFVKLDQP